MAALVALFQAAFIDHRDKLAPGEVATTLVLAADRPQARTAMRYIAGMCEHPMIRPMVKRQNETGIEFTNRSAIEIGTASHRSVRGYTLSSVVCDEIAFWHTDGASPDKEIIQAVRPALATLDGKLIALSSPYAKRGQLWTTYRRSYGDDDETRVLVAQATSRTMNPNLAQKVVDAAMRDDPEAAKAEFMAEFRSDIAAFLEPDLIDRATRNSPLELGWMYGTRYFGFVDPSGGGADEFSLAIGHLDDGCVIIDAVRGRTGSPAEITREFAEVLKSYNVHEVHGDRYAGHWPRDEFKKHGIDYQTAMLDRSGLYLEFLARLNSERVELPPCEKSRRQFVGLERRTSRGGKDSVDHAPGAHDDRANAIAGLVAQVTQADRAPCAVFGTYGAHSVDY